jgi:NADPH:quinone reductase-like Zn-dependent oxidoreductase
MKAVFQARYGPPEMLEVRDVATPVVGDEEVLVRVHAASLHPDVWHVVRGRPFVLRLMGAGFARPGNPIPGTDMAGVVESVGSSVTRFGLGDAVFGETVAGHQWTNGGAFAEFVAVHQDQLAVKPAGVTFEEAAAVPSSGLIVLQNLRGPHSGRPVQTALVNGAITPVIDSSFRLAEVREAFRHLVEDELHGKVILTPLNTG